MSSLEQAIALSEAGRNDEAVMMIRQVASTGDPHALFLLAQMTWGGGMVAQDPQRGRLLFEHAGACGHPDGGIVTTNLLGNGVAGARNWPLAVERLRAEAAVIPQRRELLQLIEAMKIDENGDPLGLPGGDRLSDRPDVRLYRKLLTPAECAHVMKVAEPLYEPSFVYDLARNRIRDTIRTSDGAAIHWLVEDPVIHAINRRIASITGTPYENGEPLQSLRYEPGQEYRPHFDFVEGTEIRRIWTALIYLNEGYEGGGTAFPRVGLEVQGKTGDVLLFGNVGADGRREPLSEHAGLPVEAGIKYLATRWVREGRFIV